VLGFQGLLCVGLCGLAIKKRFKLLWSANKVELQVGRDFRVLEFC
jgi:hypothetical protein